MIEFTVLGSGTAVQYEKRCSASYLVSCNDVKIILDCGFYFLERLEMINVMADEIDYVFISHKHPDHFLGLIHYLFARKNKKVYSDNSLTIFGFRGLRDYLKKYEEILGHWIKPDIDINVLEKDCYEFDKFSFALFPTKHSDESVGISLEIEGKKIVYTGDTEYFDELPNYCEEADLLIVECGKREREEFEGHMSYSEGLRLGMVAGVKRLLFSHFYPQTDKFDITAKDYNFKIFKARDLMKIIL